MFKYTWIPAHTSPEDVVSGRITAAQRDLNRGADALATRGKALSAPPETVVQAAKRRKDLTRLLQLFLIAIHTERKKKEDALITRLLKDKPIFVAGDIPLVIREHVSGPLLPF